MEAGFGLSRTGSRRAHQAATTTATAATTSQEVAWFDANQIASEQTSPLGCFSAGGRLGCLGDSSRGDDLHQK